MFTPVLRAVMGSKMFHSLTEGRIFLKGSIMSVVGRGVFLFEGTVLEQGQSKLMCVWTFHRENSHRLFAFDDAEWKLLPPVDTRSSCYCPAKEPCSTMDWSTSGKIRGLCVALTLEMLHTCTALIVQCNWCSGRIQYGPGTGVWLRK